MAKCARWIRLNSGWDESEWLESIPWASRAVWPVLLCHMKIHGTHGRCPVPSWARFAGGHDIPVEAVTGMIEAGIEAGAILIQDETLVIVNWETYQYGESTERVKRHRSNQSQPVTPENETVCNVTQPDETLLCHATLTETETLTETIPPVSPKGGDLVLFKGESLPFESPEFSEAWRDWVAYRKEIRHSLSDKTRVAQLKKLARFSESVAIGSIRVSIEQGWIGVFPEKFKGTQATNGVKGAAQDLLEAMRNGAR